MCCVVLAKAWRGVILHTWQEVSGEEKLREKVVALYRERTPHKLDSVDALIAK